MKTSQNSNSAKGSFNTKPAAKEAKPAKTADVKAAEADLKKQAKAAAKPGKVVFIDYSENGLAVGGDTKAVKDVLKAMNGRFNRNLSNAKGKFAAWIFSKKKLADLQKALKTPTGMISRDSYNPPKEEKTA